ncbi:MAG: DUF4838 domain-containing protein [Kiritimatiellia bacterium]|nr:DUF4838 domain-containing protein [Kiritimatiellia bacterium]
MDWGGAEENGGWPDLSVPFGSHNLGDRLLSPKQYFGQHPEWYALRGGKRTPHTQLCYSNPEVLPAIIGEIRQWAQEAKVNECRGQVSCDLGFLDNFDFCQCQPFAELLKKVGDYSGLALQVANTIASALEREFLRMTYPTLAYWGWEKPPAKPHPAHHNVYIHLCAGGNKALPIRVQPETTVHLHGYDATRNWFKPAALAKSWLLLRGALEKTKGDARAHHEVDKVYGGLLELLIFYHQETKMALAKVAPERKFPRRLELVEEYAQVTKRCGAGWFRERDGEVSGYEDGWGFRGCTNLVLKGWRFSTSHPVSCRGRIVKIEPEVHTYEVAFEPGTEPPVGAHLMGVVIEPPCRDFFFSDFSIGREGAEEYFATGAFVSYRRSRTRRWPGRLWRR